MSNIVNPHRFAALSDEQKIENGAVGGGVPYLWLDAGKLNGSDTTSGSDGDAISTWTSRSGSREFSQGTASVQPTWQTGEINSLPAVYFDGTEYMKTAAEDMSFDEFSFFWVIKWSSSPNYAMFGHWVSRFWSIRHDRVLLSYDGANWAWQTHTSLATGSYEQDSYIKDDDEVFLRTNGSAVATLDWNNSSYNSINDISGSSSQLWIGAQGVSHRAKAYVSEAILWTSKISDADRDTVESYLTTKYDL